MSTNDSLEKSINRLCEILATHYTRGFDAQEKIVLPDMSHGENISDELCVEPDGYVSKQEQIDRYKAAGERYDEWLRESYPGTRYADDGEPTEQEEFFDETLQKGFDEFAAHDLMEKTTDSLKQQKSEAKRKKEVEDAFKSEKPQETVLPATDTTKPAESG